MYADACTAQSVVSCWRDELCRSIFEDLWFTSLLLFNSSDLFCQQCARFCCTIAVKFNAKHICEVTKDLIVIDCCNL